FWANFWARGFFAETVGRVEEATVQAYIREQRP
ncbi:MAG: transposase, partial [Armatimonadetes bacterium]|nr:transposase [Armatimonadota bacterium]